MNPKLPMIRPHMDDRRDPDAHLLRELHIRLETLAVAVNRYSDHIENNISENAALAQRVETLCEEVDRLRERSDAMAQNVTLLTPLLSRVNPDSGGTTLVLRPAIVMMVIGVITFLIKLFVDLYNYLKQFERMP